LGIYCTAVTHKQVLFWRHSLNLCFLRILFILVIQTFVRIARDFALSFFLSRREKSGFICSLSLLSLSHCRQLDGKGGMRSATASAASAGGLGHIILSVIIATITLATTTIYLSHWRRMEKMGSLFCPVPESWFGGVEVGKEYGQHEQRVRPPGAAARAAVGAVAEAGVAASEDVLW
jgi:hypothetical protein